MRNIPTDLDEIKLPNLFLINKYPLHIIILCKFDQLASFVPYKVFNHKINNRSRNNVNN